jgi:hypothetical protein
VLLYIFVIRIKALELSKNSIDRTIEETVNNILEGKERIIIRFEVLGFFNIIIPLSSI